MPPSRTPQPRPARAYTSSPRLVRSPIAEATNSGRPTQALIAIGIRPPTRRNIDGFHDSLGTLVA